MATWFKTHRHNATRIEPVEVIRATEACVFLPSNYRGKSAEQRESKSSYYCEYFETWQAAKDSLVERNQKEIERVKAELHKLQSYAGMLATLTEGSR